MMGDVLSADEVAEILNGYGTAGTIFADVHELGASHETIRAERDKLAELKGDAGYWFDKANQNDRERADWKRWCEEREASLTQLRSATHALLNDIDANITGRVADYLNEATARLRELIGDGDGG